MTQGIGRNIDIENPTARAMFLSDNGRLAPTIVEQMEDNFFKLLRLPNGTSKMTYRHRLDDVNAVSNRLLRDQAPPIRLLDVAISSGVTTKEWMEALDELGKPYSIDAIDLSLYGVIEGLGERFHVLRDSRGRALQYEIWGWALANHYGHGVFSRMKRAIPVSMVRIAFALGCSLLRSSARRSRRDVLLVTPGLQVSDRLRLYEADIFQLGRMGRTFHMIRAANILNRAYFSDRQLESLLRQVVSCLDIGAYLTVVRTREDRPQNDGTVFIKGPSGSLSVVERFGTGSEVEPIALGLRHPDGQPAVQLAERGNPPLR